jgi:gamma-glutamyl phosphate reductase
MDEATRAMEAAAWAAVDGIATTEQIALLESDAPGWRRALERLLDDAEDNLDAVRSLDTAERDQAVSDLEAELDRLELAYDRLTGASDATTAVLVAPDPTGEVRL